MLKDENMSDPARKILYSYVDLEKNSEHLISKMFSYGTCKIWGVYIVNIYIFCLGFSHVS